MAKEIPLTQGKVAIVDDEDFDWLYQFKWYYNGKYATGGMCFSDGRNRPYPMHRLIMLPPNDYILTSTGRLFPKYIVDHIDLDRLNNRRSNLRICTCAENIRNRDGHTNKTSSNYKGVFIAVGSKIRPWCAKIKLNKKSIHLGAFATEIEAALAYNEAAIKYHGEFARLNEIPPNFL